jgi:hypothetical protein
MRWSSTEKHPLVNTLHWHERQKHRKFLKDQFHCLPPDILVLEVYKKATREKMALHGYIEEAIVNTLNDNCEQSYKALSKHVSGWCSYQTIERWLKSHESYASYAKNIKPGLTEGNRVKQSEFFSASSQSMGTSATH